MDGDYLAVHWATKVGSVSINWATLRGATSAARRAVGQWPDTEAIGAEVVAELERAARDMPGEKGRKLRAFLEGGAETGAALLGTMLGTALSRITGVG